LRRIDVTFRADRIDHVEVFVRDIEDAIRWYGEVLGLEETARWDPEPVMIGAGGTQLALFRARAGAQPLAEGESPVSLRWHRVAWHTDRAGFEEAQRHLSGLGIAFRGPIDHETAFSIYFQDPDGHPLEITCDATEER
jgi:catechol 2,3-dioxygenase